MKAFASIVRLELVAAVRSKMLAALTGAAVLWMFVLPRFLRDDGTAEGAFELHVRYSLGVVFALVVVSLAAAAAGTLSRDRDAMRLQLTLVRPVRRFAVALGRIVALTAVGAFVLGVAAAILQIREGAGKTCDHAVAPVVSDPAAEAERLYAEYEKNFPDFKEQAAEVGKADIIKYLKQYVCDQFQSVAAGETAEWRFEPPPDAAAGLAVRVRLADMFGRLDRVSGEFSYGDLHGDLSHITRTLARVDLERGEPQESPDAKAGTLVFRNGGKATVSVNPRRDLHLLVAAGGYGANVFRAWLELVCILAAVVSMSAFFGSALGRSVATFAAMAYLFASVVGPSVIEDRPDPVTMTRMERFTMGVADFSSALTSPMNSCAPVSALESRECVEWREVARVAGLNVLLFPLVFSLLAGLAMSVKQPRS